MPLKIASEAFSKIAENPIDLDKPAIKKYNIKVHKNDLAVLDAIATKNGIPRSHVLNAIVEKILLNSLMSLDRRSAKYVAQQANKYADLPKHGGWLLDIANADGSVLTSFLDKCVEDASTDEPTDLDQIRERLVQAIKEGKI